MEALLDMGVAGVAESLLRIAACLSGRSGLRGFPIIMNQVLAALGAATLGVNMHMCMEYIDIGNALCARADCLRENQINLLP